MGVFIKGMKMPLSCKNSCHIKQITLRGNIYCPLIDVYMENCAIGERHPDCPLVEIDDAVIEKQR